MIRRKEVFINMRKLAVVLFIIGVIMIVSVICYEIYDFYHDYECSTTTDFKWFMKNGCMKYVR